MTDELRDFLAEWEDGRDSLTVHTSGSTGKPKPMKAEKDRMMASARLTCDFLGLKPGDTALLCMPLKYIAGKMVVVRAWMRGLRLMVVEPSGHPLAGLTEAPIFAAMVPMQVYNSLKDERERALLRQVKHLIIGGGAIDPQLEAELRTFPNCVWSTYGMTETLSHIAMRRVNGSSPDGRYVPMRGVSVSLSERGTLVISAPHVCPDRLETNDIAQIFPDGSFTILGRADNVVCSGGIKIQIEEAERELCRIFSERYGRQPSVGERIQLTSLPDEKFGQRLVAIVEGDASAVDRWRSCIGQLKKYWQSRSYCIVPELRQTETGKPSRAWASDYAKSAEILDF
ncbi:MAG: AMP-binding protein [Bacteroidaceae bacterium]|nr:AMP-binding protein [Bacteroidaceae bacterium]